MAPRSSTRSERQAQPPGKGLDDEDAREVGGKSPAEGVCHSSQARTEVLGRRHELVHLDQRLFPAVADIRNCTDDRRYLIGGFPGEPGEKQDGVIVEDDRGRFRDDGEDSDHPSVLDDPDGCGLR
jgi:hypothetical protein